MISAVKRDEPASNFQQRDNACGMNARRPQGRQVAYGSQFETPRGRALLAAQAIRCKLGGKDYISIDDDMPPKPKWMRWNTYERITQRCETYEATCNLYLLGFLARLENQH